MHSEGQPRQDSIKLFYQSNLTCKNPDCSKPIWLPLSIPLEKFEHQLMWPKRDWKRNFLCLSCRQVNLYKAQDVHLEPVEKLGNLQPEKVVVSLEVACVQAYCPTPAKIYAVVDGKKSNGIKLVQELSGKWQFVDVQCPHFHSVTTDIANQSARWTSPDDSWLD